MSQYDYKKYESLIDLQDRLRAEDKYISRERQKLELERTKFLKEQAAYIKEKDIFIKKASIERKRLKEENYFFDQKMNILKDGFEKLEQERRKFETEKNFFKSSFKNEGKEWNSSSEKDICEALFKNITNSLALRKRYKDLVKIFHPDNLTGNGEFMQQINEEYYRRMKDFDI